MDAGQPGGTRNADVQREIISVGSPLPSAFTIKTLL